MDEVKGLEYGTNVPLLEGREGYYQVYLILRSQIGKMLTSDISIQSNRLAVGMERITRYAISGICDITEQKRLFTLLDSEKEVWDKKIPEADRSADAIDKAHVKACMAVLAEVSAFYDRFVGVSTMNVLGLD